MPDARLRKPKSTMQISDPESVSWLRFVIACLTVIGLMGLLALALRSMTMRGWLTPKAQNGRLKVVSSLALDARRRILLVKCDDQEHLLLLGPGNDLCLGSKPADSKNETAP